MTIQKIHAVLRKAGFSRSRTTTTRIRGWYDTSTGYTVEATADGFRVGYYMSRFRRTDEAAERADRLAKYHAAFVAAGVPCRADGKCVVVGATVAVGSAGAKPCP